MTEREIHCAIGYHLCFTIGLQMDSFESELRRWLLLCDGRASTRKRGQHVTIGPAIDDTSESLLLCNS